MYSRTKLPESLPAETVREPWRQALLDAAQYIRVHGLCKDGRYSNRAGAVCAWGALSRVCDDETFNYAIRALNRHVGHIAKWNDAPGRTAADVIATLKVLARSALREGG